MKYRYTLLALLFMVAALSCSTTQQKPLDPVAQPLSGSELFMACQGCHSVIEGAPQEVGPNLFGISGRQAGAQEGFKYSPALKEADIVWDENTLTAWIMSSESMVPGTWMLYHNHLSWQEVDLLVGYLLNTDGT